MPFFPFRRVLAEAAGESSPPRSFEQRSGVSFWF
jgi:hypothetical protein